MSHDGYSTNVKWTIMDGYLSLLTTSNRLLRLLLGYPDGIRDSELLSQRCKGVEAICEGIELRIYCVSLDARIALKTLIGLPAELQIVTDTGELRRICGIVAEASQGESDGGLASYQLVVRDALAILDLSASTRVFLNQSELDVVRTVLNEIRHANPTLGVIFEIDASAAANEQPIRQQIIQSNESTGDFIRRLLKRRGIGWFFRPGRSSTTHAESPDDTAYLPAHTMVLFGDGRELEMSPAGRVRFHRNSETEERDTITGWCGVRSLRPGRITRFSWDYSKPGNTGFMEASAISAADQGDEGSQLAAGLEHYLIEAPHVRDNYDDLCELAQQAMRRSDFESKCYYAEGGVRDCSAGEYIGLDGHPDLDGHPEEEREFIILHQHFIAQNNLPKDYDARIDRLFSRNHWHMDSVDVGGDPSHSQLAKDHDDHPFHTLAGLLANEAVKKVGKEMRRNWQGNKGADPGLVAAQFLVHPYESRWQDKIVLNWAKTHEVEIKRGESATALKAFQEGHIKEVKAKLQALSQDAVKMWNYIHKNFNVIFNEKSQVELWKN